MSAGGHMASRKVVDQPATGQPCNGDRASDHRGGSQRQHQLAAISLDDARGLAHHHQPGRGGQKEDAEQPQKDRPLGVMVSR